MMATPAVAVVSSTPVPDTNIERSIRLGRIVKRQAVTFDNGMYSPVQAAPSALDQAGQIFSSLASNSQATEGLPNVVSSTAASPAPSSSLAPTSVARQTSSGTPTTNSPSSLSASSTASNTANLAAHGNGGSKFHITYLIPLFVILGLAFLIAVVGKVWGRIAYAKERALRRRSRQERLLDQERRKEKRERVERIRQQWEQNGWGESVSPDVSFEKQNGDGAGSESEWDHESEDELKGPLSAIGTHLAGVKKGRALPPAGRVEQNRYDSKVEANNWLEVQWKRRSQAQGDQRGYYATPGSMATPSDKAGSPTLRATLRGTWERVKCRITENTGWGYDGNTPDLSQRKEMWSQVPLHSANLPHTESGLLMPPPLEDDGSPINHSPNRPRRSLFPLSRRQREGSYSPPEVKSPPNTIKALPLSPSRGHQSSARDIFTSFATRTSQGFDNTSSRGQHERLRSEMDDDDQGDMRGMIGYVDHVHADGRKCSLDEPQHLAPYNALRYDGAIDRYSLHDPQEASRERVVSQNHIIPHRSSAASLKRMPTHNSQIVRARSASSRMREQSTDDKVDELPQPQPTSILRNKSSKASLAMSRSSTVRFHDDSPETDAANFILEYPSTQTPGVDVFSDFGEDTYDHATTSMKQITRARTTANRSKPESGTESGPRRYKSVLSDGESNSRTSSKSKRRKRQSADASAARRSNSVKSNRSYTESVKFGDEKDDEDEEEEVATIGTFPSLDSRILSRNRTAKGGLTKSNLERCQEEQNGDTVVMDLTNLDLATDPKKKQDRVIEESVPSLVSGSSSSNEESERDMESEIDSALISLIARSNTSKSYYHPFPPVFSPTVPSQEKSSNSPMVSTPTRKKTWQERNGKWEKKEGEEGGEELMTPGRTPTLPASPPPLPTPPAAAWKSVASPRSATSATSSFVPPTLAVTARNLPAAMRRDTPTKPQAFHSGHRTSRGDLFIQPPTLRDVLGQPISPKKTPSMLSPSVYSEQSHTDVDTLAADVGGGDEDGDNHTATLSSFSARSEGSSRTAASTAPSSNGSSGRPNSPQRRAAVTKRTQPPRRYQAKLRDNSEDGTADQDGQSTMTSSQPWQGNRLHTGKSLRTPAEKEQERQFAMDRVQSIVTKAHARRQQSS